MDIASIKTLDWALRAGVVGLLLFVAAMLLRDHARSLAARIGAAFAAGVAAYALQSAAGAAMPPSAWQAPLIAVAAGNAVLFWIFARALFDDAFRWRAWHGAAWLVLAATALLNCLLLVPSRSAWSAPLGHGITLATLVFAVLALGQSLSSWRADLVERRRRLRGFIVGAGAVYTLLTTGGKLVARQGAGGELASLVDAAALAAIVVVVAWQLLRIPASGLFPAEAASEPVDDEPDVAEPVADAADDADGPLIASLDRLMAVEHVYREENMSIGALAARLGIPEYRLRRLINQRLGYRNFNSYLNRHRLVDAKRALADPAQAQVPVLAIAMSVGFQSIGPFNRAFKADTGLTPSEFRRLGGRVPALAESLTLDDSGIG